MNRVCCIVGVLIALSSCPSFAQTKPDRHASIYGSRTTNLALPVNLESLPAITRDAVSKVMKNPTITAVSEPDEFVAFNDMYLWLLDHPDRTAGAWRKLGVGAISIKPLKEGRFSWKDEHGSELIWQSVARSPSGRIWFAEGKVRPMPLTPLVPVTAVAVLNHTNTPRKSGDSLIKQQIEVFLYTDSKAANTLTKMLGDTAPKMAQQGTDQLLLFFSGIARLAHDKPEKAQAILGEKK